MTKTKIYVTPMGFDSNFASLLNSFKNNLPNNKIETDGFSEKQQGKHNHSSIVASNALHMRTDTLKKVPHLNSFPKV